MVEPDAYLLFVIVVTVGCILFSLSTLRSYVKKGFIYLVLMLYNSISEENRPNSSVVDMRMMIGHMGTSEEDQFAVYADLRLTCGYLVRGILVAWFSNQADAKDYLNRNTIEIADVYINKLEPIR